MKAQLNLSVIILLAFSSVPVAAQNTLTANQAADFVQRQRDTARKFYNKPVATKQDMEKGIEELKGSMRFLNSEQVKNISPKNPYLNGRYPDVLRDLVYAYAKDHQNDLATATLAEHFKYGTSFYILEMLKDSVFNDLNADAKFMAVVDQYKRQIALWGGAALKTPYQVDIPMAEKMAGLALLWSQARVGFVYFDKLTADWNQTYLDYIPQVQATKSTLEYYRVLQKFYAQLHDGHTGVYLPKEISAEVNSRPPVKTELIDGHVYITNVLNDSLRKAGIVPGLELLSIDKIPVKTYAETFIRPYQGSSTPQDLDQRTYTYFLLAGSASRPVNLELRDKKGKIFVASIPRAGYPKVIPPPTMEYRDMNGIAYLSIHNFEDARIVKQFDSLYNVVNSAKGLIIDIRDNGGGDSGIGNQILAYFTDKKFGLFAHKHVSYDALGKAPSAPEPSWANDGVAIGWANGTHFYTKPIVVLINAATFSAAEDFALAFDAMKRGMIIGEPSGGSSGQPLRFDLPGGGSARFCARRESYPDGKEFVGVGIQPQIVIRKSVDDVYSGTDTVLKKALEVLK